MRAIIAVILLALSLPVHADQHVDRTISASYQLHLQVKEPGDRQTRLIKFCSASFYASPEIDDGYTYGTTAGHCLDVYAVLRSRIQDRVWGADLLIVVETEAGYQAAESVRHGMRGLEYFRGDQVNRMRPHPRDLQDWGVIRTKAAVNTLPIAEETVRAGQSIYVSGYPLALGHVWSQGRATYPYQLPGTPFHRSIAADFLAGPGSSGSPVVNDAGEQVGILVAGIPGVGLTLSTPIQQVETRAAARNTGRGGPRGYSGDLSVYDEFTARLTLDIDELNMHIGEWIARYD